MHIGREEVQLHLFLSSALHWGVLHAPADVTLGKNPGTHRREGWESPGEGLDVSAKRIIVLKN
jgi:hypothetical protein